MKSFIAALRFLTVIPVKNRLRHDAENLPQAMVYFPVVGGVLGLVLAGAYGLLTTLHFGGHAASVIVVILLIVLTGGLHSDGLADTFDALGSGKPREEMLRIMRDPHLGAMGALSLIGAVFLKVSLLSSMGAPFKTISLVLMCAVGRWCMVLSVFLFPYARPEGKAKVFSDAIDSRITALATVIAIVLAAAVWRARGIFVVGAAAAGTCIIGAYLKRRVGGMTGDTLGAINELTEVLALGVIYSLGGGAV